MGQLLQSVVWESLDSLNVKQLQPMLLLLLLLHPEWLGLFFKPRCRRVLLLHNQMVRQLKTCDPMNCAANVAILSQAHALPLVRTQCQIIREAKANARELRLTQTLKGSCQGLEYMS